MLVASPVLDCLPQSHQLANPHRLSRTSAALMTGPPFVSLVVPLQDSRAREQATRQLVCEAFPHWDATRVDVKPLSGGITNCLLQCTYCAGTPHETIVLVRAYGRGTDFIIDRNREFCTQIHLYSHGLAPPLYARFANGLVYGFIPGRAASYTELSDPALAAAIARMLARWHTVLDARDIKTLMLDELSTAAVPRTKNFAPASPTKDATTSVVDDIWHLCRKWIGNLPTETGKQCETKALLAREVDWVQQEIQHKGGPTVVAHCDLLSGNVIVPTDWKPGAPVYSQRTPDITFIDYEYSLPTPRAFDLANHFMEWQGFDCDIGRIPQVGGSVMHDWGRRYLQGVKSYSTQSTNETVTDEEVDGLMQEIQAWWGMPGFYWGIWATIQAVISTIDFDYKTYAHKRLSEYWSWKSAYMAERRNAHI
ncbi:kinase-like domain-containing protein [Limtongia smithiae]|uniref:kinase-like domain-containing protein n=1 Tax=Limtongia smithiae TaxID=1125753 RepID=UPI0034CE0180